MLHNFNLTKSERMSWMNKARAQASGLDPRRVVRAFAILQSGQYDAKVRKYSTAVRSCECEDSQFGNVCKHRIAAMIVARALEHRDQLTVCAYAKAYDLRKVFGSEMMSYDSERNRDSQDRSFIGFRVHHARSRSAAWTQGGQYISDQYEFNQWLAESGWQVTSVGSVREFQGGRWTGSFKVTVICTRAHVEAVAA